ncbi:MAG: hypothetical protein M1828_005170 [Chrysothrix sp. TS-e1954]|nr:MAG: hypothetical protein M1828_005170 [Chrysothrix sp. TS-e1954]
MAPRLKSACVATRKALDYHNQHACIPDQLPSEAWHRFARAHRLDHKRWGSNVPGPFEAHRRLSRRRLNNVAFEQAMGAGAVPEPSNWGWFGNWEPSKQQQWMWEGPRKTPESGKRTSPQLPAWLAKPPVGADKTQTTPPSAEPPDRRPPIDNELEDTNLGSGHDFDPAVPKGAGVDIAALSSLRKILSAESTDIQDAFNGLLGALRSDSPRSATAHIIDLLRHCKSRFPTPDACGQFFDFVVSRAEESGLDEKLVSPLVQQMLNATHQVTRAKTDERLSLLKKILRIPQTHHVYTINLSNATWTSLLRYLVRHVDGAGSRTLLCDYTRLVTSHGDLFPYLLAHPDLDVLALRILSRDDEATCKSPQSNTDQIDLYFQLVNTLPHKSVKRWTISTAKLLVTQSRTKNHQLSSVEELLKLYLDALWKSDRFGDPVCGSHWGELYSTLATEHDPARLADHFSKLSKADQLRVILRYWLPSRFDRASDDLESNFNEALKEKPGRSPLFTLLNCLHEHGQPTYPLVEYVLPLYLQLDTPQEFAQCVVSLRRSKHFRTLPTTPLTQFIAKYSVDAPVSALQVSHLLNDFSITRYPTLAMSLVRSTDVPHSWLRQLLRLPDPGGQETSIKEDATTTTSPRLTQDRIDLLHEMATEYSQSLRFSPRVACANIKHLYNCLKTHNAPIAPKVSQAMVHASLVRWLRRGDELQVPLLRKVIEIVRNVEGEETARDLDRLLQEHRSDFRWEDGNLRRTSLENDAERRLFDGGADGGVLRERFEPERPVRILRSRGYAGLRGGSRPSGALDDVPSRSLSAPSSSQVTRGRADGRSHGIRSSRDTATVPSTRSALTSKGFTRLRLPRARPTIRGGNNIKGFRRIALEISNDFDSAKAIRTD